MTYNSLVSERITKLLTEGLSKGYASTKEPEEVVRSGFVGKYNDYRSPDGGHYHDEWFASDNGGGQELVTIEDESFTRLYGGGVIPTEELEKLGLTTKDVIGRLITSVNELKEKTRLYDPCSLNLPGGWNYSYSILKRSEEVPLTISYESIKYNDREVFAHAHVLSPIK